MFSVVQKTNNCAGKTISLKNLDYADQILLIILFASLPEHCFTYQCDNFEIRENRPLNPNLMLEYLKTTWTCCPTRILPKFHVKKIT